VPRATLASQVPVVVDALAARYGGGAVAAIEVARGLAAAPEVGEVVVVARRGSLVAAGLRPAAGLRVVTLRDARRLELVRRVLWEAVALPALVRRRPRTAVLTWSGMLPRSAGMCVVSVLANPTMFEGGALADRVRRFAARRTARRAHATLVPTVELAASAATALGVPTHVVALGVDHSCFGPAPHAGSELLCVADGYPHKRHDLVLAAWSALPEPRPVLRIIGDASASGAAHAHALSHAIERHRRAGPIVVESGLSVAALVDAYHSARVVVLASEQESFSLPLLEALACGVPAVARDLPAMRETGGAATTFVEGDDPADWRTAIARLFSDDAAHAQARAAALAHAAGYGWERTSAVIAAHLAASAPPP
jgi:glycosyltransferase involved in cell wall biosynthesis